MYLLNQKLSELSFTQGTVLLNALRNAIEYCLEKHSTNPGPDTYWLAKAQATYPLYRELGGYETFPILESE